MRLPERQAEEDRLRNAVERARQRYEHARAAHRLSLDGATGLDLSHADGQLSFDHSLQTFAALQQAFQEYREAITAFNDLLFDRHQDGHTPKQP